MNSWRHREKICYLAGKDSQDGLWDFYINKYLINYKINKIINNDYKKKLKITICRVIMPVTGL